MFLENITSLVTISLFILSSVKSQNVSTLEISLKGKIPTAEMSEVYNLQTTLNTTSSLHIRVLDVNAAIAFIIIQAHSYMPNITMSFKDTKELRSYVVGRNLGLVYEQGDSLLCFIFNDDVDYDADLYISVHAYRDKAPIPGGCNLEFNTINAPYLRVSDNSDVIVMEASPARVATEPDCDAASQALEHDFYHMYMSSTDASSREYFDDLKKMITVQGILKYGTKVPKFPGYAQMRRIFSSYAQTGSVYAVIATYKGVSSAYVPAQIYSCRDTESCQLTSIKVISILLSIIGVLICFLGHYFFKTSLFIFGFSLGTFIGYFSLAHVATISMNVVISLSVLMTVLNLIVWTLHLKYFGIPITSIIVTAFLNALILAGCSILKLPAVFLIASIIGLYLGLLCVTSFNGGFASYVLFSIPSMCLGIMIASIIYFGLPDGVIALQNDIIFWAAFCFIVFLVLLLTAPLLHFTTLLGVTVLGSFAAAMPLDLHLATHLRYILVNIARRVTVPDFNIAIVDPPYQWRDAMVTLLWVSLAVLGLGVQYYFFKHSMPNPSAFAFTLPSQEFMPSAPPRYQPSETTPLFAGYGNQRYNTNEGTVNNFSNHRHYENERFYSSEEENRLNQASASNFRTPSKRSSIYDDDD